MEERFGLDFLNFLFTFDLDFLKLFICFGLDFLKHRVSLY